MNPENKKFCNRKGFTLIELIIVIVILGVIGVMGADFISKTFAGFAAGDIRMEIYEEGKTALVRMEREIHNAIPNAVDLPGAGPIYTDLRIGLLDETAMRCAVTPCPFGQYTDAMPIGRNSLTDQTLGLPVGSIISIYNTSWTQFASAAPAVERLYRVTALGAPANRRMTLDRAINAASPNRRYLAADKAVRYYLDGNILKRAELDINAVAIDVNTDLPLAAGYPLAADVTSLNFSYAPASLTRNALVTIDFTMTKRGEAVNFHKEVHLRNVP